MNTAENVTVVETAAAALSMKDRVLGFAANPTTQKVAVGAASIATVGLLGWGAKKLWDRHQSKKASKTPAKDAVEAALAKTAPVAEAS